ncbi:hypothetical protein B5V02_26555 [Mesorhizobium kowhaii]|uniref:Uncharacterized protein n=1 Tax=Mesorhizobium kowhaii TaxID=1300272 RepID=A0A2W7C024_9HYPH|nr:hypothetical protein B5V02_26555 [Mesorhizobium kowhaii]
MNRRNFGRSRAPQRRRAGEENMGNACLVFVGSLNREAPYFQGARGVGLGVYSFDEATPMCVKIVR